MLSLSNVHLSDFPTSCSFALLDPSRIDLREFAYAVRIKMKRRPNLGDPNIKTDFTPVYDDSGTDVYAWLKEYATDELVAEIAAKMIIDHNVAILGYVMTIKFTKAEDAIAFRLAFQPWD